MSWNPITWFQKEVPIINRGGMTGSNGVCFAAKTDGFPHPIQDFPIVHLHHIAAARNAERFHRVGVELHEFGEAASAQFVIAKHVADAAAAIRLRQAVEILTAPGAPALLPLTERCPLAPGFRAITAPSHFHLCATQMG